MISKRGAARRGVTDEKSSRATETPPSAPSHEQLVLPATQWKRYGPRRLRRLEVEIVAKLVVVVVLSFLLAGCAGDTFAVGDCITVDAFLEPWERPVILRIIDVGERSYRIAFWLSDSLVWESNARGSRGFSEVRRYYRKVECPA